MVPEYLTPANGGLLAPGQLMALARAVFGRYGGLGVAELVLEITPDVMVGKVRCFCYLLCFCGMCLRLSHKQKLVLCLESVGSIELEAHSCVYVP